MILPIYALLGLALSHPAVDRHYGLRLILHGQSPEAIIFGGTEEALSLPHSAVNSSWQFPHEVAL